MADGTRAEGVGAARPRRLRHVSHDTSAHNASGEIPHQVKGAPASVSRQVVLGSLVERISKYGKVLGLGERRCLSTNIAVTRAAERSRSWFAVEAWSPVPSAGALR